MSKEIKQKAERLNKRHVTRSRLKWAAGALSFAVVLTTVLCLTLPAVTESAICGLETHRHNDECYETVITPASRKLTCGIGDSGASIIHTHDDYCYDEDGRLICDLAEIEEHIHTDACFRTEKVLVCDCSETEEHIHCDECRSDDGKTEEHVHSELCYEDSREPVCGKENEDEHIHTEECYDNPRKPICGKEDEEDHVHCEECYEESREPVCGLDAQNGSKATDKERGELVCGMEEGEGRHEHCEGCYEERRVLICEKEELTADDPIGSYSNESKTDACIIAHQHSEECFTVTEQTEERVLVCEIPEHTHDEDCYPDHGTFCGIKAHAHGDGCYDENGELICKKVEHTHSAECGAADEKELMFTAETSIGVNITFIARSGILPEDADSAELGVRQLDENELKELLETDGYDSGITKHASVLGFCLTLLLHGEEIQPAGTALVRVNGSCGMRVATYSLTDGSVKENSATETDDGAVSEYHIDSFPLVLVIEAQNDLGGNEEPDGIDDDPNSILIRNNRDSETATLTVTKTWSDGTEGHDPVTVYLVENASGNTVAAMILSADNNWYGEFTGLAVPGDGEPLGYSVIENEPEGYFAEYGAIVPVQTVTEELYWVPVVGNSLSDGGYYVFCAEFNGAYYTPGFLDNPSGYISALPVGMNGPITINGISYSSYITGVDESAMFLAEEQSGWFVISNAYTGKYLYKSGYCLGASSASLMNFNDGKLYSSDSYYIQQYAANGVPYRDYQGIKNGASSATIFTLYERVAVTTTDHRYATSVVNRQIDHGPGMGGNDPESPDIHKTIDYLGDGTSNPDTTLTGEEFYRLYLDVSAEAMAEPIDLLLVLDNSGSMFSGGSSLINGRIRNDVLNEVVAELIPQFLAAHPQNRISIVYFSGPAHVYNGFAFSLPTNYTAGNVADDAWTACDWTSDENTAISSLLTQCVGHVGSVGTGTNYSAGLVQADAQLAAASSTNKPYMLFLSDGVPTYYIQSNGQRGGNGFDTQGMSIMHTFYNKYKQNEQNCYQPTLNAINAFLASHSEIPVSVVAFSSDMQGDRSSLLREMPNAGGFFSTASDAGELFYSLQAAFMAAATYNVSITDRLSPYVELYGEQADYVVTMTNVNTGAVTVLYQNGAITPAGAGIVQSVEFIPSSNESTTGSVKLNFVESYELENDYVYTLSFNVVLTQAAYDTYNAAGQQYPHIGDPDTDYGTNDTSSNYPGLHSNTTAYVDYSIAGNDYSSFYPHPVVQVNAVSGSLTITKEVVDGDLDEEFLFEMILTDSEGNALTDIPEGDSYTVLPDGRISFTLSHGQSVTISGIPADNVITVMEVGHDGYTVRIKEGEQTLAAQDTYSFVLTDDRNIVVVNNAGAELPETGGVGTGIMTYGGSAVMLIALMCWIGRSIWERRSAKSISLGK